MGRYFAMWAIVLLFAFAAGNPSLAKTISGKVSVIDGHQLMMQGSNLTVRLYGVDSCAMNQVAHLNDVPWRCGVVSAGWLTQLTLGYEIKCLDEGEAGYAAIYGRCFLPSGEDIAKLALKEGMAFAARKGGEPIESAYGIIEAGARRERVGIWSSNFVLEGGLYRAGTAE